MDLFNKLENINSELQDHYDETLSLITLPSLKEPCDYLLSLGGKRIRPALCYLSAEIFGEVHREVLDACWAIELFHNFTLMHDDIMDEAPTRRGKPTVHIQYNTNLALLAGDAMNIMAYGFLQKISPNHLVQALSEFNKTAMEVCEGQQLDFEFESRTDVKYKEYLDMIRLKTSVLLANSCRLGALTGGGDHASQGNMYMFGLNLGMAFQLLDDYLDAFGEESDTGKTKGGDIIMGKKTALYIHCMHHMNEDEKKQFVEKYAIAKSPAQIEEILSIMKAQHTHEFVQEQIRHYTDISLQSLEAVNVPSERKKYLEELSLFLLHRKF